MNQYPKRLIEVDLPIRRISEHSQREKSVGTISSLHLWWARRPLAACRALILASLLPDPADPHCPESFRMSSRHLLEEWQSKNIGTLSAESYANVTQARIDQVDLNEPIYHRQVLLDFIADFSDRTNFKNDDYIRTSAALLRTAQDALGGESGSMPTVLDPFAGGGAIPVETLRVGANSIASDLNPVAVLLNKVMLEYVPKFGAELYEEVIKQGNWVNDQLAKSLEAVYPKDDDGTTPIAYLWARTIKCEGPGCGCTVPALTSLWLANTGNEKVFLKLKPNESRKIIEFELEHSKNGAGIGAGTVRRGSITCPLCGFTTARDRGQEQLIRRNGGTEDSQLLAVILKQKGTSGRKYRLPTDLDFIAISNSKQLLEKEIGNGRDIQNSAVPDEELPYLRSIFNVHVYGMRQWRHLFNSRQLLALTSLAKSIRHLPSKMTSEGVGDELAVAVTSVLALGVSRTADHLNSGCSWNAKGPKLQHLFTRQAMGMIWDFAEANPLGGSVGDWLSWLSSWKVAFEYGPTNCKPGTALLASACEHPLPDDSCDAVITDPPYYDAVPYANLSDFFYVWLKRMLKPTHGNLFREPLTLKEGEIVQLAERNPIYSYKTKEYFEGLMQEALEEARRIVKPTGIAAIFFAHKGTAAWEAQLQATLNAGWIIVASWPIETELRTRLRAMDSAVLASSIVMVCRPRETDSGSLIMDQVGDWRDVLRELPVRIHEWMPRLAGEGVVGADAIFACLGPALEIFSRYSSVEKPNGEAVKLSEYLEYVWAAVAQEALNMIFAGADATGFEEDARLSAMWLWTLFAGTAAAETSDLVVPSEESEDDESTSKAAKSKGFVLEFDAARKIAQGLGAHLEDLASIVHVKGDKATLLSVSERARDLFGYVDSSATEKKRKTKTQKKLFEEMEEFDYESTTGIGGAPEAGATTLDRIHQTMLLFGAGRSEAVRRFLVDDGVGNDERFWRLANALSALYPSGTDEKRWVDGVLARKKGLGF